MRCFLTILIVLLTAQSIHAQNDSDVDACSTHAYDLSFKTNVLGWGLGHVNLMPEFDFATHWSLALPFYYSGGFDYVPFKWKFRGIVFQPEVRYYLKGNSGFYFGVHYGMAWFNIVLNDIWRIQDHKGSRPAIGGGLSVGYSLDFKRNPRWGMEFSVGGGCYDVLYDVFYNEENGPYAEHKVHDSYYGLDNISVSFTYRLCLKKEVGR